MRLICDSYRHTNDIRLQYQDLITSIVFLAPSGLPSWILNLYWTKWAPAFVCFSFLYFFVSGNVCQIKLTTLSFWVHVKLFYRIVLHFRLFHLSLSSALDQCKYCTQRTGQASWVGLWQDFASTKYHSNIAQCNYLVKMITVSWQTWGNVMLNRLKRLWSRSVMTVRPPPGGPIATSRNISCTTDIIVTISSSSQPLSPTVQTTGLAALQQTTRNCAPSYILPSPAICLSVKTDQLGELAAFSRPWASKCLDVKNYKWRLDPVWQRMLYRNNWSHSGR